MKCKVRIVIGVFVLGIIFCCKWNVKNIQGTFLTGISEKEHRVNLEEQLRQMDVVKMADEHFLLVLLAETRELEQETGWDKAAISAYLEAVDYKFREFQKGYEGWQITPEEYLEQLNCIYQSAHQIGSDVYTYMFEASEIKPKERVLLVIEQMGGYVDSNGMLQIEGADLFDIGMPPHSEFLEDYAECVRMAYEKEGKQYRQLDNDMIHQFRMYIDKHNIDYVRKHFDGKNDYEKLRNYAKYFEFELYYGEPSRHHNKIEKGKKFGEQTYDKILTPNRLSEFIVNVETGEFVTAWDVLKRDGGGKIVSAKESYSGILERLEQELVDTESFNYAPAEYTEAHQKLDVLPASPSKDKDSSFYLEHNLKKKMKEAWKSPDRTVYKEKYRKPEDYLN